MAMRVNLQRGEGPEGQVSYSVQLGPQAYDVEDPVPIPREPGKVAKIHAHVRIFSIAEISAVRNSFECRFDLYLSWPEQLEGSMEQVPEVYKVKHKRVIKARTAWEGP
jgi:hypothetical protein